MSRPSFAQALAEFRASAPPSPVLAISDHEMLATLNDESRPLPAPIAIASPIPVEHPRD